MDEKLYQEAAPHDETCLQGHVVVQKEVTSAQRQEIQSWARQFGKAAAVTVFVMARLASAAGEAVAAAERKRKMEAAAVTIQALTRGNRDRSWLQQLLWKQAAAVKIQSLTRGHRDRRRVQKLLDELWDDPLAHLAHPRTGQTPLHLIQAAHIEHSSDFQQKLIGMPVIGTGECLILHDNHEAEYDVKLDHKLNIL